ncbi:hypothetical protein ACFQ1I_22335 [Kitasatospora arboriphila]
MNQHHTPDPNQPEDPDGLFAALKADLATDRAIGATVLDFDKARADRRPTETDPDEDGLPPVYVDSRNPRDWAPVDRMATARGAKRRPIIPAWARSKAELVSHARWLGGNAAHTAATTPCAPRSTPGSCSPGPRAAPPGWSAAPSGG